MRILGTNIVTEYLRANASNHRIKAARSQYRAWETITLDASWNVPQDVQRAHPKASILKNSRVVFNIKGNDYRLVCVLNYQVNLVEIRWFGSHREYNEIDAESI
ncbi:MAG: type II toxin-antitoxin system HigB family toxin [Capsulimonadaceae bacterium]